MLFVGTAAQAVSVTPGEEHWVLLSLAFIGSVGAIGAAYAANLAKRASVKSTERVEELTGSNTSQHASTAISLAQIADRQEWLGRQLGDMRQALLDHVVWEEGQGDQGGKYAALMARIEALQTELAAMDSRSAQVNPPDPPG